MEKLSQSSRILIQGDAGCGKSTWARCMAQQWAQGYLPQYELTLVVSLRELLQFSQGRDLDWPQLLQQALRLEHVEKGALHLPIQGTEKMLWILDGYDEVQGYQGIGFSKLFRALLKQTNVIVTTRPGTQPHLFKADQIYRLDGLTENRQLQLINQYLVEKEKVFEEKIIEQVAKAERIKNKFKKISNPLLLHGLGYLLGKKGELSKGISLSAIYRDLIEEVREKVKEVWISDEWFAITQLDKSFNWLSNNQLPQLFMGRYQPENSQLGQALKDHGLLKRTYPWSESYQFVHRSVEEYFLACDITQKLEKALRTLGHDLSKTTEVINQLIDLEYVKQCGNSVIPFLGRLLSESPVLSSLGLESLVKAAAPKGPPRGRARQ